MPSPDEIKRAVAGSPLSASDWNRIIDILKQLTRRQVSDGIVDSTGSYAADRLNRSRRYAFEVWLTQNGGANGDDGSTTTAAFPTYTYDVFEDEAKSIQIGTAVAVDFHRDLKVAVTAAGHGMAQWVAGTLRLILVDESRDRDVC